MAGDKQYDRIIIGAGIFGLYAASIFLKQKLRVAIIDIARQPFTQASFVNQARVHNGYHYPRSLETAAKCAYYYERFRQDFSFAINDSFRQIYAISRLYSKVNSAEYADFCRQIGIPLQEIDTATYFQDGLVEGAFLTDECSFDTVRIRDYFLEKIKASPLIDLYLSTSLREVKITGHNYVLETTSGVTLAAPFVVNSAYAGINQIIDKFHFEMFKIKYELCEVVLCEAPSALQEVGITVMDGPFFSLMPFGQSGRHSLTAVGHTPHQTCYDSLPAFQMSGKSGKSYQIDNLAACDRLSEFSSAWNNMHDTARSYLKSGLELKQQESLFAVKPILLDSELNDDRPTVIRKHSDSPTLISVLSGKINTIFDLDEALQ